MSPRPPRAVRVLTTDGLQFLDDVSDADASTVGRHWNAVRRYLETGLETELPQFTGNRVGGWVLETDIDAIEWHAVRGDVRFESIYDEVV